MISFSARFLQAATIITGLGVAASVQAGEFNVGLDYVAGYSQTYNDAYVSSSAMLNSKDQSMPVRLRLGVQFGEKAVHGAEVSFNQMEYKDAATLSSGSTFTATGTNVMNTTETLSVSALRYVYRHSFSDTWKLNGRGGLAAYSVDASGSAYYSGSDTGTGLTLGLEGEYRILSSLSVVAGYDYLSSFQAKSKTASTSYNVSKWDPSVAFIGIRGNF